MDFNCLDANVNLQTWVVLLDFLGMGAKIPDASHLEASMESDVSLPLTGKGSVLHVAEVGWGGGNRRGVTGGGV